MKVKICGLREHHNVIELSALQPQWMGFIFYKKSSRHFFDTPQIAQLSEIPQHIKKVGVFVNESPEEICHLNKQFTLDYIQLHGSETPAFCQHLKQVGLQIIKAFSIAEETDFESVETYAPYVDYFLFDTKGKHAGGNGIAFDWSLLENKRFTRPFLLSGGIAPEDSTKLKHFHHPDLAGIDINSRFELAPGLKNVEQIKTFMQELS